jgi:hypothetical protein
MLVHYHLFINRDLPLVERGCESKARYTSRREARTYANRGAHRDGNVHPYHCEWCDGWHLGHRKRAA